MSTCPACGETRARSFALGEIHGLYRCGGCGLVYRGKSWRPVDAIEHYEGYYEGRDVAFDPLTEKRYHVVLKQFEQHVQPGRLLDVGCGLGHFLVVAEGRGWHPVGLEVSASSVKLLERFRQERNLGFGIVKAHLLETNLPPASFRAVTLFEVLEHLSDPRAHLERIHTLLEPGGLLYLTTPNFDSVSRLALAERWGAMADRDHLCLFNPRALRECLQASGFQVVAFRTKNINLPEIVAKWWRRPSGGQEILTFPATQALRYHVEGAGWLRILKMTANAGLDCLGLGDTLEALALKRTAPV